MRPSLLAAALLFAACHSGEPPSGPASVLPDGAPAPVARLRLDKVP
jgi:hypothetical protein